METMENECCRRKGRRNKEGEERRKEGSEKAAAVRVERFAFFLPLLSFHFAPQPGLADWGKIPPSQTVPELLNSASSSSHLFELQLGLCVKFFTS